MEDVKTFYGVLKVIFSFGIIFFLEFAAENTLPLFALYLCQNFTSFELVMKRVVISNGLLFRLLIAILIPIYLFLLRPIFSDYIPGMLKKMGLGMILMVVSLIVTLAMDTAAHEEFQGENNITCMFKIPSNSSAAISFDSAFLVIQHVLLAFSLMLAHIGMFEFICSQSPHSMKGLFIGTLYAVKGLYQLLAGAFSLLYANVSFNYPGCGFYFYLTNAIIGVAGVLVYTWVARNYRYRVRDEPCKIHQYAEEYYSNPQQERNYDYDSEEEHYESRI